MYELVPLEAAKKLKKLKCNILCNAYYSAKLSYNRIYCGGSMTEKSYINLDMLKDWNDVPCYKTRDVLRWLKRKNFPIELRWNGQTYDCIIKSLVTTEFDTGEIKEEKAYEVAIDFVLDKITC